MRGPQKPKPLMAQFASRSIANFAGGLLFLLGIVLSFIPGPGLLTIVSGLALLAPNHPWARRLLDRAKRRVRTAVKRDS